MSKQIAQLSTTSNKPSLSSCMSLLYARGKPFMVVKIPIKLPYTRPVLPRISSKASGFFFCGIKDEPEVTSSASEIKLASPELKKIKSSAMRLKCIMLIDAALHNSITWSRSDTLSKLFKVGRAKFNAAANAWRSIG